MNLLEQGDATFVKNWQKPYTPKCPITGVELPDKLNKAFYDAFFPALDAKIKTPVAFAILAPYGWSGEKCDWDYKVLGDYGWEPVFWRESSHKDHTFVQLYMRRLDRPEPKERPSVPKTNTRNLYTTQVGSLPYLGCSSHLTAFDEAEQQIEIPMPDKLYREFDPKKILHFVRIARPVGVSSVRTLKEAKFELVAKLKWNQYWVRGKRGLGSKGACDF